MCKVLLLGVVFVVPVDDAKYCASDAASRVRGWGWDTEVKVHLLLVGS